MNRIHISFALGFIAVLGILTACATGVIQHDFRIQVADVEVPEEIAPTETLPVHLSGVIGLDGCHRLLRIDTAWPAVDYVQIRAMGRYEVRDQPCPQGTVFLDEIVELSPVEGGTFPMGELTVEVLQPMGEAIRRTVQVVDPTED